MIHWLCVLVALSRMLVATASTASSAELLSVSYQEEVEGLFFTDLFSTTPLHFHLEGATLIELRIDTPTAHLLSDILEHHLDSEMEDDTRKKLDVLASQLRLHLFRIPDTGAFDEGVVPMVEAMGK